MNRDLRERVLVPFAIPVAAFIFIGSLVFSFSRILLATTEPGAVVVGLLMAAAVLFGSAVVAASGLVKKVQRAGLLSAGAMLVAAGIAVATTQGIRPVERHETSSGPPPEGAVVITAKGIAFDTKELRLPVGEAVIHFKNDDPAVNHNVAIYEGPGPGAKALFVGDIFPGVATKNYRIENLPAGTFFFKCDVHPAVMTGTAIVGPGGSPAPASPASPPPGASPTTVDISAKNIAFDREELTLAANRPVTMNFRNEDAASHNVAIYTSPEATEVIFIGEIFPGPDSRTYTFTAPAPGTYFFRCDVHLAAMTGTVVVR